MFAADLSISVKLNPIIDKNGFRFNLANAKAGFSVTGDIYQAGANITYGYSDALHKRGFAIGVDTAVNVSDTARVSLGAETQLVAAKAILPAETLLYTGLNLTGDTFGSDMYFELASLLPSKFSDTNVKYYALANLNLVANDKYVEYGPYSKYVAHVDAMSKFNFDGGQFETEKFFAEASYSTLSRIGKSGYHTFGGSEKGLGTCSDAKMFNDSYASTWFMDTNSKAFRVALGYKYSKDGGVKDNGIFASAYLKDYPIITKTITDVEGSFLTAKAEVSSTGIVTEFGFHHKTDATRAVNVAANVQASVTREDDTWKFNIPYGVAEIQKGLEPFASMPEFNNLVLDASTKYVNSTGDTSGNGLFVDTNLAGTVGPASLKTGGSIGFDLNGLKDWKLYEDASVINY